MRKTSQALTVVEAKHEIALNQMGLQEDMVRSLKKEVTRLTQEQETAQKVLLDKNKEIEELTGANKGMKDTIDELLAEKTKLTNKLAMMEGQEEQRFRSRHAVGETSARETTKDTMDEEDKVTSLQREVTQLKQKLEEVQKLLLDNKRENDDLTKANKGMKDTINKLTRSKDDNLESLQMKVTQLTQEKEAVQKELSDKSQELEDLTGANNGLKDELTNKLARMEEEGKLKDRKVESLQEEVTRLKQEKEAAQKILSDMAGSSPSMNDEARGGAAGTTSDGSHHRGQRQHRFKLPSCLSPKTKP
ncbi:PREDICTED: ankycorbin-like [Branchiostoma belcheri]|uniref:Ankycorbin-like n=1 Tax=Branchiostoma belcheri TaxID=7741 RepID=A0A6P4XT85_BRABE|nr:PREDICTED: ankycorbin-like [Branchiostoma belcheri]